MISVNLPSPARYFPLEKGLYEVAPGLKSLGTDFGNGTHDAHLFQIDSDWPSYRENKLHCRKERLTKYFCTHNFSPEVEAASCRLILERLLSEHPGLFSFEKNRFNSLLSGESLLFSENFLEILHSNSSAEPAYISPFDALCSQIQEDIAIVSRDQEKKDWLSALHLCAPSHWAAEDKIGRDFVYVHEPIPHIEKINRAAAGIVEAMIHKGPYVRFVWSFVTDKRLNHHPIAPPGWDSAAWKGRSFDNSKSGAPFHLRLERQVIFGMPSVEASLFAIRVSFLDGMEVKNQEEKNRLLRSALDSMSPESRIYKGVAHCFAEVQSWLQK